METARTYLYDKSEALQEFSYDAWGNRRDPYTWTGSIAQLPMFDRGFTGHEHLFSFGLINMNGRMYDPVMSSFLSVDSYVQSPENSQNFNRYAYCLNNPLKYTDPDGEFCVLTAMAISAAVSVACQMTSNVIHEQALFKGVGRAAVTGAVQGAFSFGIGDAAAAIGKAAASAAKSEIVGKICQAGFQVVAHGTLGGYSTYARGGEFGVGFASGAVSSAISSITTGVCGAKINSKEWTVAITVAAGALSGGITAKIAGGDFWEGVCNGLISSGLNHAMHLVAEGGSPDDPPGANKEQDNTQSAIATVSGIDTGVDAALEFSSFVKTNPEFAKIWFSVEKFAKGIGITCSLTNFGVSFYRAFTGQISWNVFALQTGVSLVELGLNAIPVAGPVLSTALTSFDAGGGFDNTLYNDVWINDHSGPMPGFLNVRFGAEYNYRDFGKQLF